MTSRSRKCFACRNRLSSERPVLMTLTVEHKGNVLKERHFVHRECAERAKDKMIQEWELDNVYVPLR